MDVKPEPEKEEVTDIKVIEGTDDDLGPQKVQEDDLD